MRPTIDEHMLHLYEADGQIARTYRDYRMWLSDGPFVVDMRLPR